MTEINEKIESIVSQNRVKLHIFEPSNRKIWTIVGKAEEHWLDPESKFCSCAGYYFGQLNGKNSCYHIESQKLAEKQKKFEIVRFSDDEYLDFIQSIVKDL